MTPAEIVQIIIGVLTLIVTALVPIMIYWLQKRHEKEIDDIRKEQIAKELANKANEFLIDHESERDYLPWCVIASALHRHEHHTRKIYTDYCRCDIELQKEILKQAGFTVEIIEGDEWVDKAFDHIREYITSNDLGRDWLYDGAKYFHRGFEYYREEEWENTPQIFDPIINKDTFRSAFGINKIDIGSYIDEYLWQKRNTDNQEETEAPIPPIDYVEKLQNLPGCDEKEMCRWIMDIVYYVSIIAHNTDLERSTNNLSENYTDAAAEKFEDRYYKILLTIYYTFVDRPAEIDKEKKVKQAKKNRKKAKKEKKAK